jgi:hypothetical protein
MLSEGKTAMGQLFTLREGILNLYLDRETYERAGLEGKPHGIKGDRGSKPRWSMFQVSMLRFCADANLLYRNIIQSQRRVNATWTKEI